MSDWSTFPLILAMMGAVVIFVSPLVEYIINKNYFKKHGRWPFEDPSVDTKTDMRTIEQQLAEIHKSIDKTYEILNDTWTWW